MKSLRSLEYQDVVKITQKNHIDDGSVFNIKRISGASKLDKSEYSATNISSECTLLNTYNFLIKKNKRNNQFKKQTFCLTIFDRTETQDAMIRAQFSYLCYLAFFLTSLLVHLFHCVTHIFSSLRLSNHDIYFHPVIKSHALLSLDHV